MLNVNSRKVRSPISAQVVGVAVLIIDPITGHRVVYAIEKPESVSLEAATVECEAEVESGLRARIAPEPREPRVTLHVEAHTCQVIEYCDTLRFDDLMFRGDLPGEIKDGSNPSNSHKHRELESGFEI